MRPLLSVFAALVAIALAGVLSTDGGTIFTGTSDGYVLAVNSSNGNEIWRHQLGAPVDAAPMTYMANGKQFLIVAAGSTVTAFAVPSG